MYNTLIAWSSLGLENLSDTIICHPKNHKTKKHKQIKSIDDSQKGYIFEISDMCNLRQNPAKIHLHADVVSYKREEYHLPGGWDFPICAQLSS